MVMRGGGVGEEGVRVEGVVVGGGERGGCKAGMFAIPDVYQR